MANRIRQDVLADVIAKVPELFEEFLNLEGMADITVGSEKIDKLSVNDALQRVMNLLGDIQVQDFLAIMVLMAAFTEVGDEIFVDGNEDLGRLFEEV